MEDWGGKGQMVTGKPIKKIVTDYNTFYGENKQGDDSLVDNTLERVVREGLSVEVSFHLRSGR